MSLPTNQSAQFEEARKGRWTPSETAALLRIVSKYEKKEWAKIANELPGRTAKQCWERWFNHLRRNIKKKEWTQQEEQIMVEAHTCLARKNKWSAIAKLLPGRTANDVKNQFYGTMKREKGIRKGNRKRKEEPTSVLHLYVKSLLDKEEVSEKMEMKEDNSNKDNCVPDGLASSSSTPMASSSTPMGGDRIELTEEVIDESWNDDSWIDEALVDMDFASFLDSL